MVYCYWRCCYFLFALKLDLHHMQYYKYAKCTIAFLYYYNGNACVPLWFNLSSLSFFLIFFHLIIGRFVVCMGFFFQYHVLSVYCFAVVICAAFFSLVFLLRGFVHMQSDFFLLSFIEFCSLLLLLIFKHSFYIMVCVFVLFIDFNRNVCIFFL